MCDETKCLHGFVVWNASIGAIQCAVCGEPLWDVIELMEEPEPNVEMELET